MLSPDQRELSSREFAESSAHKLFHIAIKTRGWKIKPVDLKHAGLEECLQIRESGEEVRDPDDNERFFEIGQLSPYPKYTENARNCIVIALWACGVMVKGSLS